MVSQRAIQRTGRNQRKKVAKEGTIDLQHHDNALQSSGKTSAKLTEGQKASASGSVEERLESQPDEPLHMNVDDEDCDIDVVVDNQATTVLIDELNLQDDAAE